WIGMLLQELRDSPRLREAEQARPRPEMVPVVVADMDIPRFTVLQPGMLKIRECPKGHVHPGAFARMEDVVGRSAAVQLVKGEPVLDARLSPRGAGRGAAMAIPKGMRACTIHVPNVAAGVAGLLQPGCKVDVVLTKKDQRAVQTLVQNVEVLAVDQRA